MATEDTTENLRLELFCSRQADAFRAYMRPGWVPKYLLQHLDKKGEAYPVHLDFDDLARHMRESGSTIEIDRSALGGVLLVAAGSSAETLAGWLAGVFGTNIRTRPAGDDDESPSAG
jgi:hypothetical protein